MVNKGCFSWEVEEGVKCACFLRRIYEEVCDIHISVSIPSEHEYISTSLAIHASHFPPFNYSLCPAFL